MPPGVKKALVDDTGLHDPGGVARTGLYTVPGSSVRDRVAENGVPTLLVQGIDESRFEPHAAFAVESMPRLESVRLEAGHAVNAEAADEFNEAVVAFFGRNT
jgi:pimeloyl-ACP methyl ester carboxylesterase